MNETSPQLSGSAQSGRRERKCNQIITIEFDKAWAGCCKTMEEGSLPGGVGEDQERFHGGSDI